MVDSCSTVDKISLDPEVETVMDSLRNPSSGSIDEDKLRAYLDKTKPEVQEELTNVKRKLFSHDLLKLCDLALGEG